ncbi:hypothetical protein HN358_03950 [Candidatus Uhrbacteria bacterium]|nr:hypothetical protein [Candidatus Uhrbacteria bacterium]MBT7716931.1 hypothetical protein [Candidatus Uhrbacteria bacterium]
MAQTMFMDIVAERKRQHEIAKLRNRELELFVKDSKTTPTRKDGMFVANEDGVAIVGAFCPDMDCDFDDGDEYAASFEDRVVEMSGFYGSDEGMFLDSLFADEGNEEQNDSYGDLYDDEDMGVPMGVEERPELELITPSLKIQIPVHAYRSSDSGHVYTEAERKEILRARQGGERNRLGRQWNRYPTWSMPPCKRQACLQAMANNDDNFAEASA